MDPQGIQSGPLGVPQPHDPKTPTPSSYVPRQLPLVAGHQGGGGGEPGNGPAATARPVRAVPAAPPVAVAAQDPQQPAAAPPAQPEPVRETCRQVLDAVPAQARDEVHRRGDLWKPLVEKALQRGCDQAQLVAAAHAPYPEHVGSHAAVLSRRLQDAVVAGPTPARQAASSVMALVGPRAMCGECTNGMITVVELDRFGRETDRAARCPRCFPTTAAATH